MNTSLQVRSLHKDGWPARTLAVVDPKWQRKVLAGQVMVDTGIDDYAEEVTDKEGKRAWEKRSSKEDGDSDYPRHCLALWWTTRLMTVGEFVPAAGDFLAAVKGMPEEWPPFRGEMKTRRGIEAYPADGSRPVVTLEDEEDPTRYLTEQLVHDMVSPQEPQCVLIGTPWADLTYDLLPPQVKVDKMMPRRVSLASHAGVARPIAALVRRTCVHDLPVETWEEAVGKITGYFKRLREGSCLLTDEV